MDIIKTINYDHLLIDAMEYQICHACGIVDRDVSRIKVGTPCTRCGVPSKGGMAFFDVSIYSMIQLIEESFRAIPDKSKEVLGYPIESVRAHTASTVIFFCIIKEILLERFLNQMALELDLPQNVIKRLQSNHNTHTRRLKYLFPTLTGKSWVDAIKAIDAEGEKEYADLNKFIKQVTDKRILFIHDGIDYDMRKPLAEKCLKNLFPLLEMYVDLHNYFVYPLKQRRKNEGKNPFK